MGIGFGCSTTTKTNEYSVSALKDSHELEMYQLTSVGTNVQGNFHPTQTKIVYVSGDRENHKAGQIYEMDLTTKKEHRVSFNAGVDASPVYHPTNDLVLFSSTTDYVKENLPLESLRISVGLAERTPATAGIQMPPQDVYLRSIFGSNIRRLSNAPDFEGDARFTPDGKKIIYSQFSNQNFILRIMNLQTGAFEKLKLKYTNLRWPTMVYREKQKKIAGILETPEYSRLVVQDAISPNIVYETTDSSVYQQPYWHPKDYKLVVSSNRLNKNNFDLFVYDFEKSCVQRITYSNALDQEPAFNPNGDKILFTSNRSGKNQIFMIRYDASQPCESLPTSI